MNDEKLKQEFEKHINSRACERPSKEMLFEFFKEGFKLAQQTKPETKKKLEPKY